jgi:hypothetical protein
MAKVNFDTIFIRHEDGSIEPKQRLRIGGVTLGPGVKFNKGVSFSGVDFTQFIGNDFEVETDGDILVIKGIYGKE